MMIAYDNFFKIQSNFSLQSIIKNILVDNHSKIIYETVRCECSSSRVRSK